MISAMDKNDLKITKAKAQADGKYFSLFEKHIPAGLADGTRVLLYALGNIDCIDKIIRKNPRAEYFIYDSDRIITAVKLICDEVRIFKSVDMYDIDMKFDCIIMNPPYERNLHLKILAEAIKHLKDEKSRVVNLSPVRWLQDPLAKYKKHSDWHRFQESIANHIDKVDVLFAKTMSDTFNIQIKTDLAVYVANTLTTNDFNFTSIPNASHKSIVFIQNLYEKILKANLENVNSKLTDFKNKTTSNYVFIIAIGGVQQRGPEHETHDFVRKGKYGAFINDLFNGKTAKEIKDADKRSVWGTVDNWPLICFSSGNEAKNFFNSACTNFMQYLAWAFSSDQHVPTWAIPWLGDSINPRTGLKGYESEWTDEDFYKFFNITDDEQKIIEDTMAKYAK